MAGARSGDKSNCFVKSVSGELGVVGQMRRRVSDFDAIFYKNVVKCSEHRALKVSWRSVLS